MSRKNGWSVGFHSSQPCKDRLARIDVLWLGIDQDDAHSFAV